MIKKIIMPPGGQTTTTAKVVKWLVKKGDKVKKGDDILETETDKAVLSIESFATGIVIDILVQEDEDVSEGDVLAVIGNEEDMLAYQSKNKEMEKENSVVQTINESEDDDYVPVIKDTVSAKETKLANTSALDIRNQYPAMPNAKKAAKEKSIDISHVTPSSGRIVKLDDVLEYAKKKEKKAKPQEGVEYEVQPLTKMRETIAKRMLESVDTIPMYHETIAIDMRAVIALRQGIKQNIKVSYNDIIMKCLCVAIKSYPLINASYMRNEIFFYKHVNIGLAVSVQEGLLVPVVKNAEEKSLTELAEESHSLIGMARNGSLQLQDMSGGTITLSNLGIYPVDHFMAIINPPESCILAIGQIQDKPVWEDDKWAPVPTTKVTASFDHRVIDGAYGAQFLSELKKIVENPALAL